MHKIIENQKVILQLPFPFTTWFECPQNAVLIHYELFDSLDSRRCDSGRKHTSEEIGWMWCEPPPAALCVCVCARAHGPAARAAVTRQWDTHVKDFCGSFARIINTVKFCFRNQNTFACSLWNYTYDWQVWELRVESFGETSLCSFFSYLKVRINSLMSPRAKSTISSPLCVG